MVSVLEALEQGRRPALEQLARQLAAEIEMVASAEIRLATVRAFLATIARLEALDVAAARVQARAGPAPPSGPDIVDELRAHRQARLGRRSG
jgi:hypothetical protein